MQSHQLVQKAVATSCVIFGCMIAARHPLASPLPVVAFFCFLVATFWRPTVSLPVLLALIPIIGLTPWSGWLTFEETDLGILAFAAGTYARLLSASPQRHGWNWSKPTTLLLVLISCSLLVSMGIGFADAGGFVFGWDQGYEGPMNAFRLTKSFFLAVLITPLIVFLSKAPCANAKSEFPLGIALSLFTVSLAALWERLAYSGLLNFSSDYRSTALFWEMHVGGAALDGWLLLTAPFAVWAIRNAKTPMMKLAATALAFLGGYAVLITFSRATYLAIAIAIPYLLWRLSIQYALPQMIIRDDRWRAWQWIWAVAVFGLIVAPMFSGGGYRGALAVLGLAFIGMSSTNHFRSLGLIPNLAAIGGGLFFGGLLVIVSNFVSKGPYFLYAALFMAAGLLIIKSRRPTPDPRPSLSFTTIVIAMFPASANIAGYWGGVEALPGAILSLSIVAMTLAVASVRSRPLWPKDIFEHAKIIGSGTAVAGLIAALLGGAYIGERFSTTDQDLHGRYEHWQKSIAILNSPSDFLFGKGLGRFPQNYFFSAPDNTFPGSYHTGIEGENRYLSLSGGNYSITFGDMLRITQRIDRGASGPFNLQMRIRAKTDVAVHVEICDRHLLYPENCITQLLEIKAAPQTWQVFDLKMNGNFVGTAKTFRTFAVGLLTQRGAADFDDIVLSTTDSGNNLLSNGDFSQGNERWFMTSDRNHLPWHAKNLMVNVLFDQGLIGLSLFTLLSLIAFWRSSFGRMKQHPLAPYLASSILGFWVVGLFDSLIDAPRVAFIYYLICLYALALPNLVKYSGKKET